ncbi:MAG: AAA family ATPase [Pseudomonadota bacterium]
MITTVAIAGYRSLRDVLLPMAPLTVITGANGSGKSNVYRALRLLASAATGQSAALLAREGGLPSVLWAGPERFSKGMRSGEQPVQGGPRQHRVSLRLGFASDEFSYAVDYGLPEPQRTLFSHDPEIKREAVWHGPVYRPGSVLTERRGPQVVRREGAKKVPVAGAIATFDSMLTHIADPERCPEVLILREQMRGWRFYDHFRTDQDAPARQLQVGTRTPVLSHDGHDLAAALQTINEIGDAQALATAVDDAFPGASLQIEVQDGRFGVVMHQHGLLRALTQAEFSDGTLRYLLWIAALLTPRPPALMVMNEPETSLHPDLMPALARLIDVACEQCQVWVVTHSTRLAAALEASAACESVFLTKELGATQPAAQGLLDAPPWRWPSR